MSRNVGIAAALAVVGWAFYGNLFPALPSEGFPIDLAPLISSFSTTTLETTKLVDPVAAKATTWSVFQRYLAFAHAHNLPGVKSLTYKISPICTDPAQLKQCNGLMDSVYAIGSTFDINQFKHVYADEKQTILYTDYIVQGQSADPIRMVLFFVNTPNSDPKIMSIKFCLPDESDPESCLPTQVTSQARTL